MKTYVWNVDKNDLLENERGISFEELDPEEKEILEVAPQRLLEPVT